MIEVKKKTSVAVLAVLLASVVWLCLAGGVSLPRQTTRHPTNPRPRRGAITM